MAKIKIPNQTELEGIANQAEEWFGSGSSYRIIRVMTLCIREYIIQNKDNFMDEDGNFDIEDLLYNNGYQWFQPWMMDEGLIDYSLFENIIYSMPSKRNDRRNGLTCWFIEFGIRATDYEVDPGDWFSGEFPLEYILMSHKEIQEHFNQSVISKWTL